MMSRETNLCLPSWFRYPPAYARVVELALTNIEPWSVLNEDRIVARYNALRKRFPDRELVPFAKRDDCDDIACWEKGKEQRVVVIHDFASQGFEDVEEYDDFWAWFRAAVEVMIDYD